MLALRQSGACLGPPFAFLFALALAMLAAATPVSALERPQIDGISTLAATSGSTWPTLQVSFSGGQGADFYTAICANVQNTESDTIVGESC